MPPGRCSVHKLKNRCLFMYSCDIQYIDLKKSCIHATYHKSRRYLTLMTVIWFVLFCFCMCIGLQMHLDAKQNYFDCLEN